jgi:hypothetical protein
MHASQFVQGSDQLELAHHLKETALALHAYRGLLGSTKSIQTTQQRLNSTAVATLNRQFPY